MKPTVREKFSSDAGLWASLYKEASNRGLFRYNNKIYRFRYVLEGVPLAGGGNARALDAGCGAGQFLPSLTRRGYRPTGVDIAEPMVEAARRLCAEARLNATVLQADCLRLAFEDGYFDACIAVGFLEHQRDEDAALAELARVIKRGGRLVITARNKCCVYVRWKLAIKALLRQVRRGASHFIGKFQPEEEPYRSKEHTPWSANAMLRKHGLRPVRHRYCHFYVLPYPLDITRLQALLAKPLEGLNSRSLGLLFASTFIVYADRD